MADETGTAGVNGSGPLLPGDENTAARADAEAPLSNYQTVLSFCLLCFLSLGVYYFFWFYKHWVYLREEKQEDISPGMRTLFTVFFGGVLFSRFFKLAREKGFRPLMPAWPLFLLFLTSVLLAQISSLAALIALFSFLFLVPVVRAMNYYYLAEHPSYRIQKGMAKDEKIFLLLFWLLFIYLVFFAFGSGNEFGR